MGLRPVLGRLLDAGDDGPKAAGAAVLTHRFWTTALKSDPSVIGKTIRLDDAAATIVGVLEPSVPYPSETEIIANVVTSPHHLVGDDGDRARAPDDGAVRPARARRRPREARAELRAAHGAIVKEHPVVFSEGRLPHRRGPAARSDHLAGADGPARAARGIGAGLHHRVLERREPDPRAVGAARRRAGGSRGARRQPLARCAGRCSPKACCSAAPARARGVDRAADGRVLARYARASRCARST